ncbi:MAG: tRNA U34 5-methylaminomethyl-2-thiouridine-forming methyltransferase MnmC [Luteibaculaceae bacterium]|jgi:tRNA U34 5-methylaminomethyl-2-thiouridine-forming methyltransferase MnmC
MHKLNVLETGDGSFTLELEGCNEQYHSKHGALQEAMHVFIRSGLDLFHNKEEVRILEVGLGTGLNCALTLSEILEHPSLVCKYTGLEPFPLDYSLVEKLGYADFLNEPTFAGFTQMHTGPEKEVVGLHPRFSFEKHFTKLEEWTGNHKFDLIYYDAFGPRTQGELWEKSCFEKLAGMVNPGGVFVTYCAKGSLKRDLASCGFEVETLPGPPGKREMVRGVMPY